MIHKSTHRIGYVVFGKQIKHFVTREQLIESVEYLEATIGCIFDDYGIKKKKLQRDIVRFMIEHRHEYNLLKQQQPIPQHDI